jgi:hypothetical protein
MRLITLARHDAFDVVERFELIGLHLPTPAVVLGSIGGDLEIVKAIEMGEIEIKCSYDLTRVRTH